jgi:hypothetical protein
MSKPWRVFFIRAMVILCLLATFYYFAELSFFHAWAGSLPAGRNLSEQSKEWHLYWSGVFSDLAVFSFLILVVYCGWNIFCMWKRKRRAG